MTTRDASMRDDRDLDDETTANAPGELATTADESLAVDGAADGDATTSNEWLVQPGTEVLDSEGTLVGRVDDIRDGFLVVRKGRFFVADYYIPFSAIGSHDANTIYLAIVADEASARIWHQRPAERGQGAAAADSDHAVVDAEARMEFLTDRDGTVRIPVLQEELIATRRPVVRGTVRVETHVHEHEQTLEVPVTEERVRVQRRTIDRDASGNDLVVDGGTFEIPFYGEDVDLERRVRVIEEIIITREAVETVRRVRGTVRREDVEVDDSGVPHVDGTALQGGETPMELAPGNGERSDGDQPTGDRPTS